MARVRKIPRQRKVAMAENIPPHTNASNDDATRGIPFYERLKHNLRETLQNKRLLDKNLASIEDQIYRFEASYLEETGAGNIIKGFDNYIKGSSTMNTGSGMSGGGTSTRRKGTVMEQDRVFSRSSASFMRDPSEPPSSAQDTPVDGPTPTSTQPLSARDSNHPTPNSTGSTKATGGNKKKKAVEKDEDEMETKAPKRLKITYNRGEKAGD